MYKVNPEFNIKYLNTLALNPFVLHDSSVRQQMFGGHISQCLVLLKGEESIVQTGAEYEFGKFTFNTKMPSNGKILKVIQRYPSIIGTRSISENPETVVIYHDTDRNVIDCFNMETYKSFHQHFGFPNIPTKDFNLIRENNMIAKDTVFLDSPAKGENGEYKYGINLEVALMTHPAVAEDAIAINRDTLEKLKFKLYEKRVVSFGKNHFPLNIYGTIDNYKILPDIGEYIREDGLLFACRPYNEDMVPMDMNIYSTMTVVPGFDLTTYSRAGKGKVIDIKIMHNDLDLNTVPEEMVHQLTKYITAQKAFYESILNTERKLRSDYKKVYGDENISISNEFHRLIIEALMYLDDPYSKGKPSLNRVYRNESLDDFRVEVVIEYEITPTIGFKLTDTHGG